jgi:hypothetical protein
MRTRLVEAALPSGPQPMVRGRSPDLCLLTSSDGRFGLLPNCGSSWVRLTDDQGVLVLIPLGITATHLEETDEPERAVWA